VAKKVNIRLLKESIWHVLDTETRTGATKPARPEELSFTGVMSSLALNSPAEQMKDVSVAYCFICLLHLANEKGLRVVGNANLTDLTVSQSTSTA
jgi:condensin complex subunit 2